MNYKNKWQNLDLQNVVQNETNQNYHNNATHKNDSQEVLKEMNINKRFSKFHISKNESIIDIIYDMIYNMIHKNN